MLQNTLALQALNDNPQVLQIDNDGYVSYNCISRIYSLKKKTYICKRTSYVKSTPLRYLFVQYSCKHMKVLSCMPSLLCLCSSWDISYWGCIKVHSRGVSRLGHSLHIWILQNIVPILLISTKADSFDEFSSMDTEDIRQGSNGSGLQWQNGFGYQQRLSWIRSQ